MIILFLFSGFSATYTQESIRYTGDKLSNPDYHHGELVPAVGVHNIQIMRSSREYPDSSDGFGWTYHHGPNMAYFNDTFYVQWLSNPIGEHVAPGQVLMASSGDGYNWSKPRVAFPPYKIPDGTTKEGHPGVAKDLFAVLHQRSGFFLSENDRLLTLGYYGICLDEDDSPNDGKGVGRVVREIYKDGSLGPIYFIRYNSDWDESNTSHPFYESSPDEGFVKACEELLDSPLMVQQWAEESDRDDPLIRLKEPVQALSFYHLPDGRAVGLWKYALTAISEDEGNSWPHPEHAPGFFNKNAKIWGQKTSDGRYATVYNPSMFRWPLAVSVSEDGLEYTNLLLVNGQITTARYGGQHKQYGPQYMRGILEGNGNPPDGDLWITYSMNKEDIWVADVPVPVSSRVEEQADDDFDSFTNIKELDKWNLYMPQWAPIQIEERDRGGHWLALHDWDKHDYAVAERMIPSSKKLSAEMIIEPGQSDNGKLHIEFKNAEGNAAIRIIFNSDGLLLNKAGYNYDKMLEYDAGKAYTLKVDMDTETKRYDVYVDGERVGGRQFYAPVHEISRISFRTGERRYYPTVDSPRAHEVDLKDADELVEPAVYYIKYLKTSSE